MQQLHNKSPEPTRKLIVSPHMPRIYLLLQCKNLGYNKQHRHTRLSRTKLPLSPNLPSSPNLLQNAINLILILQLQHLRCLIRIDIVPIQEETKGSRVHSLAAGVGVEYFGHFGSLFDFKEGLFARLCGEDVGGYLRYGGRTNYGECNLDQPGTSITLPLEIFYFLP